MSNEHLEKIGQLVCEIHRLGLATNLGASLFLGWHPFKFKSIVTDAHGYIVPKQYEFSHPIEDRMNELQLLLFFHF